MKGPHNALERDLPGGPVVKLPASTAGAMASTPGRETKILRGTAKKILLKCLGKMCLA